jgi:hypothetical protein
MLGNQFAVAQDQGATGFAAVDGQRGGQHITGPYDVVADWPKDLTILPGHEDWVWGAGQSVFAESLDRIYVLQRGELPNVERPVRRPIFDMGPSVYFPIGRLPWRDATASSLPGNGGAGTLAEEGIAAW